jgi:putative ribosome biogenesis GTPase RsgA
MENESRKNNLELEPAGPDKLCMVVVMGVTGAGKSHFINKLAGSKVTEEGDSLHARALLPLNL